MRKLFQHSSISFAQKWKIADRLNLYGLTKYVAPRVLNDVRYQTAFAVEEHIRFLFGKDDIFYHTPITSLTSK